MKSSTRNLRAGSLPWAPLFSRTIVPNSASLIRGCVPCSTGSRSGPPRVTISTNLLHGYTLKTGALAFTLRRRWTMLCMRTKSDVWMSSSTRPGWDTMTKAKLKKNPKSHSSAKEPSFARRRLIDEVGEEAIPIDGIPEDVTEVVMVDVGGGRRQRWAGWQVCGNTCSRRRRRERGWRVALRDWWHYGTTFATVVERSSGVESPARTPQCLEVRRKWQICIICGGGRGEQVEVPIIRGSLGEVIMLWVRIGLG